MLAKPKASSFNRKSIYDICFVLNEKCQQSSLKAKNIRGVFQCFWKANTRQALQSIDFGFRWCRGPNHFKNAVQKKEVFSKVPIKNILSKTDSQIFSSSYARKTK
jgi:Tat protein secretion system quality control protein TatD with DNase activity